MKSQHILVLRFSAMGDVALLTPIVKSFLGAYPDHQITVVSRPKFSAFFTKRRNFKFFSADVDKIYIGLKGLFRLFTDLRKLKPDVVIDLHDHVRSRFICFLFRLIGTRIIRFDKGRADKKLLTQKENKVRKTLPHTVQRYQDAFVKAGFQFSLLQPPFIESNETAELKVEEWLKLKAVTKTELWIGVAPFAAHKSKIWPTENYPELIKGILEKQPARFFLFGGGEKEIGFFKSLSAEFPEYCTIVAGELKLQEEIALIKKLDKMICVDSSNMHLASLIGIPTISLWGGTHTDTGFGPFGQNLSTIIQIDPSQLFCRPCSVYGKETCWRGDFACQNLIKPEMIIDKLTH